MNMPFVRITSWLLMGWLISFCGCVAEFQPATKTLPSSLVVDGLITDQPGPYSVRLTRTADYTQAGINLLEVGAVVVISDNQGQQETLTETSPGYYQTKVNGLQGIAGRRYTLTITTTDGKRYTSTSELLTAAPPINQLYYEYRTEPTALTAENREGWDVYIDTKDPATTGDFYRWTWTHYEQLSNCQIVDRPNQIPLAIPCCTACWEISRCYNCVDIKSDAIINGNTLSRQLITRVPYTSLTSYYIEVQQQRLSAAGYAFWQSVKSLTQQNGGLFDAAPTTVRGNMRCTNTAGVSVFGYFSASGISEVYTYVDRSAAQGQPNTTIYEYAISCAVCADNGYRTPNKPRWWKD